jgi:peptidoglycan/xylan/chitin deacetylase (PgdA/CDA1 family)
VRSPRIWAKDAAYLTARVAARRVSPVRAILMYHDVGGPAGPDETSFTMQMRYLVDHFRTVRLNDLPETISTGEPVACVTFDDGYRDACERAAPILDDVGVPATFFLPSGLMGEKLETSHGPREVIDADGARGLAERGHEIGAHSITHPRLTGLPRADAELEIGGSRDQLQATLGAPVSSFAYPKGDHDEAVVWAVREAGFRLAVTVREGLLRGSLDRLRLPRVAVHASTTMPQFRAKLSGGLEVYESWRGRG